MGIAKAQENEFTPTHWSEGLHLNVAGGLNFTKFNSDDRLTDSGYGLNFKTDLGYYFTHNFAFEVSSSVTFVRSSRYLVWDTIMTVGPRFRFGDQYLRAFFGRSPTVVFIPDSEGASRLQYNGPVYGLALGKTFQKKSGLIWFIESAVSYQRFIERESINSDGDVPVVISSRSDKTSAVSLYFMIGAMVF